jgi:hypothetical protein
MDKFLDTFDLQEVILSTNIHITYEDDLKISKHIYNKQ